MYVVQAWIGVVISAVLGFIIIARLHAMYRRSRKVLIFLATIFLVVNVSNGVITAIIMMRSSGEERILSGTSHCSVGFDNHDRLLVAVTWALITAWETIALCFAGWIAAKHFRELRQSTGWVIRDYFTVLIKTHVFYFASFVATSCFHLSYLSPTISLTSMGTQIYPCQIFSLVQMFVLGPRLIIGVREHHAKLVADFDAGSTITSLAFEVHVPSSSVTRDTLDDRHLSVTLQEAGEFAPLS